MRGTPGKADLCMVYGRDAGAVVMGLRRMLNVDYGSGTAQPQRAITYDNNGHIMGCGAKANSLLPLFDAFYSRLDGGLDDDVNRAGHWAISHRISRFNGTIGEVIFITALEH